MKTVQTNLVGLPQTATSCDNNRREGKTRRCHEGGLTLCCLMVGAFCASSEAPARNKPKSYTCPPVCAQIHTSGIGLSVHVKAIFSLSCQSQQVAVTRVHTRGGQCFLKALRLQRAAPNARVPLQVLSFRLDEPQSQHQGRSYAHPIQELSTF